MKKKKGLSFISVLLLVVAIQTDCLRAQDTTVAKSIILDPHMVIGVVRQYALDPGLTTARPDSIQQSRYLAGTLTDLLAQNGLLFVKGYGNGNLATTTIRGASAAQTPVFWNGINIQSTTNGNVDLSLIPAILCDYVSIQNGGGSAGWGSGAIGGVIQTFTLSRFNKGLEVRYSGLGGSFGQQEHGMKVSYSNAKYSANVRAYRQTAENDFTYRNLALIGFPKDTITNSFFFQEGIMGEFGVNAPSYRKQLHVRAWYQRSDRGIPATMLENSSTARQQDEFFRAVANWTWFLNKISFAGRSAVLTEYLNFDPGYQQDISLTHSLSVINEIETRFDISQKITATAGVNDTWSKANVTLYVPVTIQNRASLFTALRYIPKRNWNFVLNLRDEEVNGKLTPVVGALGGEWTRNKLLSFKASVSRNYRIPTFNDLYWVPGGNRDLKPEDSWNQDVSAILNYVKEKHSQSSFLVNYSVTAYNRSTTNWILWQPGPGYWSPENLLSVWSRGFEHRLKVELRKYKFTGTFLSGYDYVRATSEKSKSPGDVSIGKQLIYVPANHFYGMLQLAYCKFYVAYTHQFTGLRFTATDHTAYLPAFDVADLTVGKRVDMKNSYGDIFFRINNLFGEEYQAVSWRPMPGRYFQVGVTLNFNPLLKSKTTEQ